MVAYSQGIAQQALTDLQTAGFVAVDAQGNATVRPAGAAALAVVMTPVIAVQDAVATVTP
jgi:hypothetical protein